MIAVAVLGVGATWVHLADIARTGNVAPGNSIQIVANVLKPALLIPILAMNRRAERGGLGPSFDGARMDVVRSATRSTGLVGAGFGIGYAIGYALPATLVAATVATIVTATPIFQGRHRQTTWAG